MKVLVVLSALVACCVANPGFAYSALSPYAYGAYGHYGAYGLGAPLAYSAGIVGAHSVIAAPAVRTVVAAPAVRTVVAAPAIAGVKSQYHAQDELGQASYGHTEPLQAHHAIQDAHGNKVGSYSYLNPHDGQVHRTDYVADALGYRVAANDLPAAPLVHPVPVVDTPEVVAAKAAHLAEVAAAAHRTKRSAVLAHTPASTAPLPVVAPITYAAPAIAPLSYAAHAVTPLTYGAHAVAPLTYGAHAVAPLAYGAHAVAPLAYGAHAVRDATLTTIVNNPGHAVSYRVD